MSIDQNEACLRLWRAVVGQGFIDLMKTFEAGAADVDQPVIYSEHAGAYHFLINPQSTLPDVCRLAHFDTAIIRRMAVMTVERLRAQPDALTSSQQRILDAATTLCESDHRLMAEC